MGLAFCTSGGLLGICRGCLQACLATPNPSRCKRSGNGGPEPSRWSGLKTWVSSFISEVTQAKVPRHENAIVSSDRLETAAYCSCRNPYVNDPPLRGKY